MLSLLAHQPGPGSHIGVTFSEKFAQIWTKNIENVNNNPKWAAVARYGPILQECEATASLKPTAHLLAPKTPKRRSGNRFEDLGKFPVFSLLGP